MDKLITIKKGTHMARPHMFGVFHNKRIMEYEVTFHDDCRYHLDGGDQGDINKLFGLGFTNAWKVLPIFTVAAIGLPFILWEEHHKFSARFGWTWDIEHERIAIFTYCYNHKIRESQEIQLVPLNTPLRYRLQIQPDWYTFSILNKKDETLVWRAIPSGHKKQVSFPLNPYFGGNQYAPQDIHLTLNKI
jgi:hypothetical protein